MDVAASIAWLVLIAIGIFVVLPSDYKADIGRWIRKEPRKEKMESKMNRILTFNGPDPIIVPPDHTILFAEGVKIGGIIERDKPPGVLGTITIDRVMLRIAWNDVVKNNGGRRVYLEALEIELFGECADLSESDSVDDYEL